MHEQVSKTGQSKKEPETNSVAQQNVKAMQRLAFVDNRSTTTAQQKLTSAMNSRNTLQPTPMTSGSSTFSDNRTAEGRQSIQLKADEAKNKGGLPIQRRGEYRLLNNKERDEVDTFTEIDYHHAALEFETQLGRLASVDSRAISAADELSSNALALVLQHIGPQATMDQLGEIFGTDKKGNTGSVGQSADAIREVFESGNFREKMTLVYNAYANRVLAPIITNAIVNDSGQDLSQVFARPDELSRDRAERHVSPEDEQQTTQSPDDVQFPPLSDREQAFGVEDGELQWQPGMNYFYFDLMSQYAQEARQLRVPYGGGRSGTTYILLKMAAILGIPNLYHMRLACLGWMIPAGDHTFYEIMVAGRESGLDYIDGPLGYRLIAPLSEGVLRGICPGGLFPDEYLDEDYKDEVALRRFPDSAIQLKPIGDSDVIQGKSYYHGRPDTRVRAESGVQRDIMTMIGSSRTGLDFDPTGRGGFYLTENRGVAANWSQRKAERTRTDAKGRGSVGPSDRPIPTLYSFNVAEEDIAEQLTGKTFGTHLDDQQKIQFDSDGEKQAWQEWVLASRLGQKDHAEDFVEGPMISNPTAAQGIVRAKTQEKGADLTEDEQNEVAHEHVRWDPDADQIALYSETAATLFDAGRQPDTLLDWDDRDYQLLEVAASFETTAQEQLDVVGKMSRDEQAWYMYNNRLFSETETAKTISNRNKTEAINNAFSDKRVRGVVWREVRKMKQPPGSIAYEYDRYVSGSPPSYDYDVLSQLPGVTAAIELSLEAPLVKKKSKKKPKKVQVQSDAPSVLDQLSPNELNVFRIIYNSVGFKVALPDSRDATAVFAKFQLSPEDFFAAFLKLRELELVTSNSEGPYLRSKGKAAGKKLSV